MAVLTIVELLTDVPGLTDNSANSAVGVGDLVESNDLHLAHVNVAFSIKNALVGTGIDDLANENAILKAYDLAFYGNGILVDYWRVNIGRFVGSERLLLAS